jgi:hypothetical protein
MKVGLRGFAMVSAASRLRLNGVKIQGPHQATKKAPRGDLNYSFLFGLRGPRIGSGATFF